MLKAHNFENELAVALEDPSFRKEWEEQTVYFEIAKQLIGLRIKTNMSQKELARKAGTTLAAIHRLETGDNPAVTMAHLERISVIFGLRPYLTFEELKTVQPKKRCLG